MGDRTQINLVVDQSQKDEWEAYAEESEECTSLSHLIRLAVSREIHRDDTQQSSTEVDVQMSGIDDRIDSLEQRIGDLSAQVQTLVDEREGESLEELAGEVYDTLPRIDDEDEWWDRLVDGEIEVMEANEEATEADWRRDMDGTEEGEVEYIADRYLTVPDLARQLEVSEYRARKAVDRVEDSFTRVKTQTHEGDTYVYEVV